MTTEEADNTPRSRKRAARRISNEQRDAVNRRVADGPSQLSLTTLRQVTDISNNTKKVQSGNVRTRLNLEIYPVIFIMSCVISRILTVLLRNCALRKWIIVRDLHPFCCRSLEKLSSLSLQPVGSLLLTLRGTDSLHEKHLELVEKGPLVLEALEHAKRMNKIPAPKLGGATRWCIGHFESLKYIEENLPTIVRFVADEVNSGCASESVKKCAEIIRDHDTQELMNQAHEILTHFEYCS